VLLSCRPLMGRHYARVFRGFSYAVRRAAHPMLHIRLSPCEINRNTPSKQKREGKSRTEIVTETVTLVHESGKNQVPNSAKKRIINADASITVTHWRHDTTKQNPTRSKSHSRAIFSDVNYGRMTGSFQKRQPKTRSATYEESRILR